MPKPRLRPVPSKTVSKPDLQESTKQLDLLSRPEYQDQGISHQLQKIARKVALSDSIPSNFRTKVSILSIHSIIKQLLLNEIEASLFSIYLESFAWRDVEFSLDQILLYTGLLAKFKLNPSIDKLLDQLASKNPQFLKSFMKYKKKYLNQATADGLQINQKYNELALFHSEPVPISIEYNFLVDEILRTSVSYNIDKKEPQTKDLKAQKSYKQLSKQKKKHAKVPKKSQDLYRNTLASPSPIHFYPGDSSPFFPNMSMERVDSLCSDFLCLSNGPSINEHFKKMTGMDYTVSRRTSDSKMTGCTSDPLKPVLSKNQGFEKMHSLVPGMENISASRRSSDSKMTGNTSEPLKPALNKHKGFDKMHSPVPTNEALQVKNLFYRNIQ